MKSSVENRGIYSTKHAGVLLGVDAIYLSEVLDTVRSILVPCWAHYFQMYSFSPSTQGIFPPKKPLGVNVLWHPVLIFVGTKTSRTGNSTGQKPRFPSCG